MSIDSDYSRCRSSNSDGGSDSGSDSSSDCDCNYDDEYAQIQRARGARRLPKFHPPSKKSDHFHQKQKPKKHQLGSLTQDELNCVVATFSTFASFAAVRMRRQAEAARSIEKLQFYDSIIQKSSADHIEIRKSPSFKAKESITGIGDVLDRDRSHVDPTYVAEIHHKGQNISSSAPSKLSDHRKRKAVWRRFRSLDGKVTSVEILQDGRIDSNATSCSINFWENQRRPCGLCSYSFKKNQLQGRVSRMAIARLRRKWNSKTPSDQKSEYDPEADMQEIEKYGLSRCYDHELVCIFCLQMLNHGVDDPIPPKNSENHIREPVNVRFVSKVGSTNDAESQDSAATSASYLVEYKAFSKSRSFQQKVRVRAKNKSPIRARRKLRVAHREWKKIEHLSASNRGGVDRYLRGKEIQMRSPVSMTSNQSIFLGEHRRTKTDNPYSSTIKLYSKFIRSMQQKNNHIITNT